MLRPNQNASPSDPEITVSRRAHIPSGARGYWRQNDPAIPGPRACAQVHPRSSPPVQHTEACPTGGRLLLLVEPSRCEETNRWRSTPGCPCAATWYAVLCAGGPRQCHMSLLDWDRSIYQETSHGRQGDAGPDDAVGAQGIPSRSEISEAAAGEEKEHIADDFRTFSFRPMAPVTQRLASRSQAIHPGQWVTLGDVNGSAARRCPGPRHPPAAG